MLDPSRHLGGLALLLAGLLLAACQTAGRPGGPPAVATNPAAPFDVAVVPAAEGPLTLGEALELR
ncbi:MAG: hypothetical protein RID90_17410, partial [Marinovum algicola]